MHDLEKCDPLSGGMTAGDTTGQNRVKISKSFKLCSPLAQVFHWYKQNQISLCIHKQLLQTLLNVPQRSVHLLLLLIFYNHLVAHTHMTVNNTLLKLSQPPPSSSHRSISAMVFPQASHLHHLLNLSLTRKMCYVNHDGNNWHFCANLSLEVFPVQDGDSAHIDDMQKPNSLAAPS